ncbi:MAG: internalization-related competence protein ComEC/Rec2 protein [Candidatus Shapirobacteria bacterium GW2011_GWE1_38_10]|uniref:Internalization-related competence protein ComEC/Rec2 protein n=1 Tax=Candidatus Shapirobacteria bacterium GW2011_GWE1_38_10 TaxID=1618488 RepID=A0A0G0KNW0_9BACT|nr:MAG: internalization-related competence protein ComEC/Rec2 protein [Candidatus Shapirobacteria bacterium GW2011_GWF2_37_20]KKQ50869.1 MAG: internalization-related competence protein ComEC/Rec2 protein [Candidatus Shapirobacteria bacterium GW2011_GWE1_38_10]KKQ63637.1 MAG: internalization-related competence protein ComEC/Rec2 protein [Candidatus Shapirobacteria bacterium GW2011_GWF1_38_23]
MLGAFLIVLGLFLSIPDGRLRMVFCDVGQGDGAIIVKGNWQMLIDTGTDNGKMERCLDRYLPFWDRKIEGVIISHWDKDHSGALSKIMKNYKIEKLFESTDSGEKIEQMIYTDILRAGDIIRYDEIHFEILYPLENEDVGNESSLVAVLNYRDKKFMFTGDMDVEGEGKIMTWWQGRVDGLKVSHHGSDSGNSEEWIKRLSPAVAVISVGKNNYGHPKAIILDRLEGLGVRVLRTDAGSEVVLGWN